MQIKYNLFGGISSGCTTRAKCTKWKEKGKKDAGWLNRMWLKSCILQKKETTQVSKTH